MLRDFISAHRDEILARARRRVALRNAPVSTNLELTQGLPAFLDQLGEALRKATALEAMDHAEIALSADQHGADLFRRGLTVAQVVHDYGDLCQVITGLAVDQGAGISADEFRTLNLCLDDAIAGAVTAFARHRESAISDASAERLGALTHELRNILNGAVLSFTSIKRGSVGLDGSTGVVHEQSLRRLQRLIDRSLAEVRLDAGLQNVERIPIRDVLEEVESLAAIVAQSRGLGLSVDAVDASVIVEADRQTLAAAVANVVQNGLKFTRPATTVRVRVHTSSTRVLIEVEDECGGLPPNTTLEMLVNPRAQQGAGRTDLGLGLSICWKAVRAIHGDLRVRNVRGKGCVFTIDLPKQPPPPTSIRGRARTSGENSSGAGGGMALAKRS